MATKGQNSLRITGMEGRRRLLKATRGTLYIPSLESPGACQHCNAVLETPGVKGKGAR